MLNPLSIDTVPELALWFFPAALSRVSSLPRDLAGLTGAGGEDQDSERRTHQYHRPLFRFSINLLTSPGVV